MSELAVVGLSIMGGFLGMAVIFWIVAAVRIGMTKGWVSTTGVVVDRRSGRADGGMPAIYPTFRWVDEAGTTHQRTSNMRQSLGPSPGTRVPVKYDPADPDRAVIDTPAQSGRLFRVIAVVIAAVGLVVGGYLLYIAYALSG